MSRLCALVWIGLAVLLPPRLCVAILLNCVLSSHNSSALSTLSYCRLCSAAWCPCITVHVVHLFPSASRSVVGRHVVPSCGKHELCEGWKWSIGCYCPMGILLQKKAVNCKPVNSRAFVVRLGVTGADLCKKKQKQANTKKTQPLNFQNGKKHEAIISGFVMWK